MLDAPLAIAAARGFYLAVHALGLDRVARLPYVFLAAYVLLAGYYSFETNRFLMSVTNNSREIGYYLRPLIGPSDVMISVSNMDTWYSGGKGYIWKYFGQVVGQDGFSEFLRYTPPAAAVTFGLREDWLFWGDTPPWAKPTMLEHGYVQAGTFGEQEIFLRKDIAEKAGIYLGRAEPWGFPAPGQRLTEVREICRFGSGPGDGLSIASAANGSFGWTVVDGSNNRISVVEVDSTTSRNALKYTADNRTDAIVVWELPGDLDPSMRYQVFGGIMRTQDLRGTAWIDLVFNDKRGRSIHVVRGPEISGSTDWTAFRFPVIYVPEAAEQAEIHLRVRGTGVAYFGDIIFPMPYLPPFRWIAC
jgi:hypothetical protein